jgi:hypothetical protein
MIMSKTIASVRITENNPNHHLWNNHGTWWTHYTVHLPDYTKRRVRVSLETTEVNEARSRRDRILSRLGITPHVACEDPEPTALAA